MIPGLRLTRRSAAALLLLAAVGCAWFAMSRTLTPAEILRLAREATAFGRAHPAALFLGLALANAVCMALGLPSKAALSLLAGALLGTLGGAAATTLGVLSGTTVLFFAVRRFFRDRVEARLGPRAKEIERRIGDKPIRAVIGLRLCLPLPYGLVTLSAALTPMRYREFLAGSIAGDVPVVLLYTGAADQLVSLESFSDALSPETVLLFVLAGLLVFASAVIGRSRSPRS